MPALLATRVVEHQAHIFRKFWRGSVFAYVLNPVLFLGRDRPRGRRPGRSRATATVDGVAYLAFVTPGLMAAAAMQGAAAESLWPIMAGTKWIRTFHAMVATPIRPGDVYLGVVAWTAVRAAVGATVFLVVAALLGGVLSWWAPLAIPAAVLTALAFAAPLDRVRRDPGHRLPVPRDHAARDRAAVPVLRARSSRSRSCPAGSSRSAGSRRSGTASQLCRGATTGIDRRARGGRQRPRDPRRDRRRGRAWGVRTFTRKLAI